MQQTMFNFSKMLEANFDPSDFWVFAPVRIRSSWKLRLKFQIHEKNFLQVSTNHLNLLWKNQHVLIKRWGVRFIGVLHGLVLELLAFFIYLIFRHMLCWLCRSIAVECSACHKCMLRKFAGAHLDTDCPRRLVACDYCNTLVMLDDTKAHEKCVLNIQCVVQTRATSVGLLETVSCNISRVIDRLPSYL